MGSARLWHVPVGFGSLNTVFVSAARRNTFRVSDHDPTKLNRDHGLAFCLSMIFFRKPVPTFRDHALAFRTRARGRGLRKVILPRASVEVFDLFDLLARRAAHGPFLRFGH